VAEQDAIGAGVDPLLLESLGEGFAQSEMSLWAAIEQQLRPVLLQDAIQDPAKFIGGVEALIGNDGVHRHRVCRAAKLRPGALEAEQALRQRRQRGVEVFGARRGARPRGRDEGAASDRRDRDPRVDEFFVGERDGVAVDAEIFCEIANRGQSIARFEPPAGDLESDVIGDLAVDGALSARTAL